MSPKEEGRRGWRHALAWAAGGLLLVCVTAIGWRLLDSDPEPTAPDQKPTQALISRGEYLTRAADCAACHTAPGGAPFSGGVAFKLPFGVIYSTNITADRDTGIGAWSDDDVVRALHRGIAKGGTHLYPAFPYTSYTRMTRDDAVAIKAYLFSLPPVHAPARPNALSFPFDQRWAMAFWNIAFLDAHRFRADPRLSAQQNRGAYLATALGHCGECHTPRNLGFAMNEHAQLAGATVDGWRAYNLTQTQSLASTTGPTSSFLTICTLGTPTAAARRRGRWARRSITACSSCRLMISTPSWRIYAQSSPRAPP
jgi:mono/diheme cytochrome c family protein